MTSNRISPFKWANNLTQVLDAYGGSNRFPVMIKKLALEYSQIRFKEAPLIRIDAEHLDGCEGALVASESEPRTWGILYDRKQSVERARFTVAHEFGHYLIHRQDYPNGFRCDEEFVTRRNGIGVEQEADQFAATLLMPFHDFRRQISDKDKPNIDDFATCAERYGVSLTATISRWLEYTERRAMMVVSREGFALWAKSSDAAFKSGRFLRTKHETIELPAASPAVSRGSVGRDGIKHDAGIWFDEPVEEFSVSSDALDIAISVLQFGDAQSRYFQR